MKNQKMTTKNFGKISKTMMKISTQMKRITRQNFQKYVLVIEVGISGLKRMMLINLRLQQS